LSNELEQLSAGWAELDRHRAEQSLRFEQDSALLEQERESIDRHYESIALARGSITRSLKEAHILRKEISDTEMDYSNSACKRLRDEVDELNAELSREKEWSSRFADANIRL
jgi:chromosome segregation ATPase